MSGSPIAKLNVGATFAGRFRIERILGRGGMGAVHEAVEIATEQRVALKVLAPQLVSDPKHRARFAREAKIASSIDDPHVVRVLDAGVDEASDTPWLTMELLRGEPLSEFVKTHGRLDAKMAIVVLRQIAAAVSAAHAKGVIHRDLKPDNVFVVRRPTGEIDVKILDFGIAKLADESGARTTGALGSPLWMAPEEARKEPLTPAADVWAFGLVAYFVLVGREVWLSASSTNVAHAMNEVLLEPLPNPLLRASSAGVTLPRGFDAWFARTVVREVSARIATIDEAERSLESVLASASSPIDRPSIAPEPASPEPTRAPAAERRFPMAFVYGAATVLTLGIGVVVVANAMSEPPSAVAPAPSKTVAIEPFGAIDAGATSARALAPPPPTDPVLDAVDDCLAEENLRCAIELVRPAVLGAPPRLAYAQLLYDLCESFEDAACVKEVVKVAPNLNRAPHRELTFHLPPPVENTRLQQARARAKDDPRGARELLQRPVLRGEATPEEVNLLRSICAKQKDAVCLEQIDKQYPAP